MSKLEEIKRLREKLKELNEQLETVESEAEAEKAVVADIDLLLEKHKIDEHKLLELLRVRFPELKVNEPDGKNVRRARGKGKPVLLTHPKTGEEITYKGGNNRDVARWKEELGDDAVKVLIEEARKAQLD